MNVLTQSNLVGPRERQAPSLQTNLWLAAGVAGSILAGCAAATEMAAWRYHFSPLLGPNLSGVYLPWSILPWYARWSHLHPQVYQQAGAAGLVATLAGLSLLAVARFRGLNRNTWSHGSARWANKADLRRAGLLGNEGVYVGGWLQGKALHYLRHNGPENVLVYAPPRSGKGVSLIVPTLLSWPHSAVIADLKGELWQLSAGWRQAHAGNNTIWTLISV